MLTSRERASRVATHTPCQSYVRNGSRSRHQRAKRGQVRGHTRSALVSDRSPKLGSRDDEEATAGYDAPLSRQPLHLVSLEGRRRCLGDGLQHRGDLVRALTPTRWDRVPA